MLTLMRITDPLVDDALPKQICHVVEYAWGHVGQLLRDLWLYVLLVFAFVLFVVENKGIVIGKLTAGAYVTLI